jgi:hypothetical protein
MQSSVSETIVNAGPRVEETNDERPAPVDDDKALTIVSREAGVELSVTVNSADKRLIIRVAHHSGARSEPERIVLDRLCAVIEGRPFQEAADHGAIYAVAALPELRTPVHGISSPRNAGAPFVLAERLLRQAHSAACKQLNVGPRENAWYVKPGMDWLRKNEMEQAATIKPMIAEYLRANGYTENDLWICRIERGTRVTIAFADRVPYAAKPQLMMALEQKLREHTGDPLELFMEDMKDANKIRRL